MKKIKKLFLIMSLVLIGVCFGCTENNGPYGKRIEEDLTSTNILDDNYRNYYEIFVRSFYDSDGNGIGDLQGVIQKLDYIQDLGFTGIWLMPINSSTSYHKYDVTDYYAIDKNYGTMEDLEELIEECHKRDIKLILDLVLNHSGSSNKWFSKSKTAHEKVMAGLPLTEEEKGWDSFYCFYDNKEDIPYGKTCQQVSNKGYYYECNFSSNMPEFNLDNELVHEEFKKILKFYLDKGIDGFRLDAVKYFYMESHAKSIAFLKKLNEWTKAINPKAYIVGECWDSAEIISQYYTSGCDSFFNFTTSSNNSSSGVLNALNQDGRMLNRYYDALLSNVEMAGTGIPAPFLDNHDMSRFTSSASPNKSKFQYALLSMMNGSTFTYYGDEVGMVGSNGGSRPDENVRIPILWGEGGLGDCKTLSAATENNYPYDPVKDQMEKEDSIYNFYKKCLLIRNQNPEIARGTISLVEMDRDEKKMLFIAKEYNGSKIGIIINFSPTENLNVDYQNAGFTKVVGQLVADTNNNKYIGLQKNNSILLPPYSIAIVK
ncbi:alpha amylase [bacterium]|nr:alpha amylase [bacterium]